MVILINIDTALENASVSISRNGELLDVTESNLQNEHSAFLHVAIQSLLKKGNYEFTDVDGIAVVEGPGSYTGLRVGMAAAKGLCFALKKPLITVGTLPMMSLAVIEKAKEDHNNTMWFCPMIDARRLEIYTAVYDRELNPLLKPCAIKLEPRSFDEYLKKAPILFFGSGAVKWKGMVNDPQAFFHTKYEHLHAFNKMAYNKYIIGDFADNIYSEPLYLKDFHQG